MLKVRTLLLLGAEAGVGLGADSGVCSTAVVVAGEEGERSMTYRCRLNRAFARTDVEVEGKVGGDFEGVVGADRSFDAAGCA